MINTKLIHSEESVSSQKWYRTIYHCDRFELYAYFDACSRHFHILYQTCYMHSVPYCVPVDIYIYIYIFGFGSCHHLRGENICYFISCRFCAPIYVQLRNHFFKICLNKIYKCRHFHTKTKKLKTVQIICLYKFVEKLAFSCFFYRTFNIQYENMIIDIHWKP